MNNKVNKGYNTRVDDNNVIIIIIIIIIIINHNSNNNELVKAAIVRNCIFSLQKQRKENKKQKTKEQNTEKVFNLLIKFKNWNALFCLYMKLTGSRSLFHAKRIRFFNGQQQLFK